jgi:hypothetical protein
MLANFLELEHILVKASQQNRILGIDRQPTQLRHTLFIAPFCSRWL